MFLYDGKVRVAGSVLNEVFKEDMSAAEVTILRRLHGSDAIVDLVEKEAGEKDPTDLEERERLKNIYCKSGNERRTPVPFDQMFGPEHVPLPPRLMEFKQVEEATAAKTTKTAAGKAAGTKAAASILE